MTNVSFDKKTYERFKRVYEQAVRDNRESFVFLGNEYLTSYARYLIEYLKGKLDG